MLEANLPVAPKCREPSQTVLEAEIAPSTARQPPPVDKPPRFYRTVGTVSRCDSPAPERSQPARERPQAPLEETRRTALDTLALCRNVITSLELTRLRKSRTGLYYWLAFWDRLYERYFARALAARVTAALSQIDSLFRGVSHDLHQLTQAMEEAVLHALSEREVLHILERMEDEVGKRRRRRRKKAHGILDKMRANIQLIPVRVSDELFDDMKRGVFALDVYCDYHPGDPVAEEHESTWPEYFMEQSNMNSVVSPYLYQQWQGSAASGSYMPLGSYTANQASWDYAEMAPNEESNDGQRGDVTRRG